MQKRFIPRLFGAQSPYSLCIFLAAGLVLAGLSAGSVIADPPVDSNGEAGDGEPRRAEGRVPDPVPRTSSEAMLDNPFLRNALSRSHEGLEATRAPDGTLTLDLKGRFQNVTTATIGDDGSIETHCAHSHESLEAFLAAHPNAESSDFEAGRAEEEGDDEP